MGMSEGVRRVAVVVKVLGWLWLLLLAGVAAVSAFQNDGGVALLLGGIGIIGIAIARVVAWVIEGFGS